MNSKELKPKENSDCSRQQYLQRAYRSPSLRLVADAYYHNRQSCESKKTFIDILYRENQVRLSRSLRTMMSDPSAVEDIVHDAFVRIAQLEEPETLEYPYAYLYRTAVNLIKDRAKAQRIRDDYRQQLLLNDYCLGEDCISPEHHLIAQEKLSAANLAINALPKKRCRVFLLCRLEGYSHQEISNQIGISKFAVEKHIMRANDRLRRNQPEWIEDVGHA